MHHFMKLQFMFCVFFQIIFQYPPRYLYTVCNIVFHLLSRGKKVKIMHAYMHKFMRYSVIITSKCNIKNKQAYLIWFFNKVYYKSLWPYYRTQSTQLCHRKMHCKSEDICGIYHFRKKKSQTTQILNFLWAKVHFPS